MAIAETMKHCLADAGIEYELITHPRSGSTHESAEAAHVRDDHIAKAVIVHDAGGYAMAVIPGSHWLKIDALNEESGRSFELAAEDEIERLFPDCAPGAIPPLGPAYGLETFLDQDLASLSHLYLESGDHRHLVRVGNEDFLTLLKGVRHGYFSHDD